MTRKMERKYRDEGWHNPSVPIDYLLVYLLHPLPPSPFSIVALMKGPSVIVLISPLSSPFLLLRSLSTNPPLLPVKRYRYERVNRIGRRTGARIPAQTFAHASKPSFAHPPPRESMKPLRVRLLYIVCHNDIVSYRF